MTGVIKNKSEVAQRTLRVEFDLSEPLNFLAGQYITITIPEAKYNDARGLTRDFSIVSSPNLKNKLVITTRLRDSAFKKALNEAPVGTQVEVDYPSGRFTLPTETNKPIVLLAGGIGVTPFMSMISFVAENKTGHKITLVYSNRDQASTAYLKELQQIEKDNSNIKLVLTMTQDPTWPGEKRRIDANFIKECFPDLSANTYMTAGPPEMVGAIFKSLVEAGVDPQNIKSEDFAGY